MIKVLETWPAGYDNAAIIFANQANFLFSNKMSILLKGMCFSKACDVLLVMAVIN
jgi:hypothetical protein